MDGTIFGEGQPCFGCAPDHPAGFRLRFRVEGDSVVTRFVPAERFQGPPGIMHGGLVMTLGDEIAAWTLVGLKHQFGFTSKVEGRLKAAVRIGVETEARGRIAEDRGRMVDLDVTVSQAEQVCFEGRFRFVIMPKAPSDCSAASSLQRGKPSAAIPGTGILGTRSGIPTPCAESATKPLRNSSQMTTLCRT